METLNPRTEIVAGLVRRGDHALITGPTKIGKSLLALDLAIAVATGHAWHGHKTQQTGFIAINTQSRPGYFNHRAWQILRARGINLTGGELGLWDLAGYIEDRASLPESMLAQLQTLRPGFILLDTLHDLFPEPCQEGIDWLFELRKTGATLITVSCPLVTPDGWEKSAETILRLSSPKPRGTQSLAVDIEVRHRQQNPMRLELSYPLFQTR